MSAAILALPAEHANIILDALIDSRCFSREASAVPGADMGYWAAQIQRIDAAYVAMTVASLAMKNTSHPIVVTTAAPVNIGDAFAGGIYAGISRGVGGAPDQRLVLLPGEAADVDWEAAGAFAASAGGVLPTRAEQALLFANLKDQFQRDWYWSSEQAGPSTAWTQGFGDGGQHYGGTRSYEGRARAVRRLEI